MCISNPFTRDRSCHCYQKSTISVKRVNLKAFFRLLSPLHHRDTGINTTNTDVAGIDVVMTTIWSSGKRLDSDAIVVICGGQTSEAKDWRGTVVASTVLTMQWGFFFLLQGHEVVGPSASGHLCMKRPWPGIARTIYGNHQSYLDIYFKPHPGMRLLQEGVFPLTLYPP